MVSELADESLAYAPHLIEHEAGNHTLCDADECFQAKLAYWRSGKGGLNVSIPSWWKGPSWMAQQKDVVNEAVSNGYDPVAV